MSRTAWLVGLVALGLGPAAAQEADLPRPDLGDVLIRARRSGALERVLGERWFLLEDPAQGEAILRVDVVEAKEPPSLVVDVSLTTLGQEPGAFMNTQVLLGWDGGVQAFRTYRRLGDEEARQEARVEEGELRVRHPGPEGGEEPGEGEEEVRPWHEGAIPGLVLMFVLPSLYDQGLPLPCRVLQLDENSGQVGERLLTGEAPAADPRAVGPRFVTLALRHHPRHDVLQHEVHIVEPGRIQRLELPSGATMTAVSALEAQRRLGAARGGEGGPAPGSPPGGDGRR